MSKPWYTLNINISNAIRSDFDFNKLYANSKFEDIGIWIFVKDDLLKLFNAEWLEYLRELKLNVGTGVIFYRPPYYKPPVAHIDIGPSGRPGIYAVNWVLDPDDNSHMVWFETPDDTGEYGELVKNAAYVGWPMEQLVETHRRSIKNIPTLVSTGIPHDIIVYDRPRWVISVRFNYSDTEIQTWDDAVAKFKDYIKE